MTNYEKACQLLSEGKAQKHCTYYDTGIIVINFGGNWCGYIDPNDIFVSCVYENELIFKGNISDDLKLVESNAHNRTFEIVA